MSQPRRRRRRGRRRGSGGSSEAKKRAGDQSSQDPEDVARQRAGRSRRARGRRGRSRGGEARPSSPKSSEDLVRGDPKRAPARLTRDHDGTTLEQVIGELQSEHGVPQHPQEYRITLKVAEERSERPSAPQEMPVGDAPTSSPTTEAGRPKREKAPAAPRMGANGGEGDEAKSSRRRRSRRRRRKPKSS